MEEDYRMDDEGEEDVMGLLFATNGSDEESLPPSGMGKGRSKSRAVPMDGIVDSSESVSASSSTKVQRKRRRKPLPDELKTEYRIKHDNDDGEHESDEADSRTRAISAPAPLLDAHPKKCRRTTKTTTTGMLSYCHHCRYNTRRPIMRRTVIDASASERGSKVYCDDCIEERYVLVIPSPQTFEIDRPCISS